MVTTQRPSASTTHARGFVMIPAPILYDEALTGDQVRTWAALEDLQRDEPHVDATTHQLAQVLHCSHDTVQRRIDALEAAGWLRVTRKRGLNRANRYVVLGTARRSRAATGTRSTARSPASSQEHADVRVPSVSTEEAKKRTSCPQKGCEYGWINGTDEQGRETTRRCPGCNDTPAPF